MNPTETQIKAVADRAWHSGAIETLLQELGSSPNGLSASEAAKRLAADGPNALTESKRVSPVWIFLAQFQSLIIWILIAAGALSAFLGDWVDASAILAIVLLNAGIGFYQEFQAEQSIAALRKMTAPHAKVRRDGQVALIPADGVVNGDILVLEAGDLVAADARLLEASSLKCMESPLTGESEAVLKDPAPLDADGVGLADRVNLVFSGTSVVAGTAQALVVAVAMHTELGRIAGLINASRSSQATPLQRKLDSVGRILVWAALGVVALLFGLGLLRGVPFLDLFMTSISLAVAAVPEGLPAVVTVALSLGVSRMARRGSLIRKLAAVETLGSTNVICTDKTGTLTVGQMTARSLFVGQETYEVTGEGYGPQGEVRFAGARAAGVHSAPLHELATALLASNHAQLKQEDGDWRTIGDPTEGALLSAGLKAGGDRDRLEHDLPTHQELPFDSDRKRSTTIRRLPDGSLRAFVNGAPDSLLERCTQLYTPTGIRPLTEPDRQVILSKISAMAQQALRVLGSAQRPLASSPNAFTAADVERDLVFVGLTGMYDPPRPEAGQAIALCRAAGIRVVMITGDHPSTATAIARELGLDESGTVVTGLDLDHLSDDQLREKVPSVSAYARVSAAHKLRIVHAWQANDALVAMTGDGVNDAPAIQGADIGIAMGKTGTEVTKQAADMIITDDNFATIVAAVEEGRGIYRNIRQTLEFLLAGNAGELLLMAVAVVVGLPAPLLPIHLLWINLVTDGLPALCLAADPIDPDVMARPPRRPSEPMMDTGFLRRILFTGILTAGVSFAAYVYFLKSAQPEVARAAAFTVLVFAELIRSFGVRSGSKPMWRTPLFSNPQLLAVVTLSVCLQFLILQNATLGRFLKVPVISISDAFVLLALGTLPTLLNELVKLVRPSPQVPS